MIQTLTSKPEHHTAKLVGPSRQLQTWRVNQAAMEKGGREARLRMRWAWAFVQVRVVAMVWEGRAGWYAKGQVLEDGQDSTDESEENQRSRVGTNGIFVAIAH